MTNRASRTGSRFRWVALVLTALLVSVTACSEGTPDDTASESRSSGAGPSAEPRLRTAADLVPDEGAWWGVSLDWSHDSVAAYAERLGHRPAVVVTFAGFPLSRQEKTWLQQAADQAHAAGSILLLTLEPHRGLAQVTRARAQALADRLDGLNRDGVPAVLRFAHEMNGSWYEWGQQPGAYVAAFRRVASAVHDRAPGSAMMWAPNYGGGYPFSGGRHEAAPGTPAFRLLDTSGDGAVTQADDPYAPYWPGRRAVDWVGMSLYHWGSAYPWGENEVPEPGKFVDLLRGTYRGANGDERAVPDFYGKYGAQQHLPVAVTETAALYVPGGEGPGELTVKRAWWRQVFDESHARRLPWLKMVNWFEWRKEEPEVNGVVDWTATRAPRVDAAFRADLPAWLDYAP